MDSKRKSRKHTKSRRGRVSSSSGSTDSSTESESRHDRKSRHHACNRKSKHSHRTARRKSIRYHVDRVMMTPPRQQEMIMEHNHNVSQSNIDTISHLGNNNQYSSSTVNNTYEASSSLVSMPGVHIQSTMMQNSVPEFDPSDSAQSIKIWIHKVNECSKIYNWNDMQTCHFALQKLTSLAKRWYQGLPSLMFSWEEWKAKLLAAFPSNENYGD